MLANERAKLATRGVRSGQALSDEDVAVLLENVEAQIIDAMVCVRKERELELQGAKMELELAKIDLERERAESRSETEDRVTVIIELQARNSALKSALTAVNDLLALYLYPSKGVKDG